ncbi:6-pyruvoyltetrahydropterin/6-carboxytetrahydropterin synthase [Arthrobacter sp. CAN_A212]|uniref:6-pyruvoyl trahydropterin synthase family protein n=1 Tax=unclassified Arthrobacter TaxID=235627 RepID=UPI0018CAAB73|nr:6-carboxytetrahydropterin synthase [Arthrobacter sp. CAN_C5]MBP2216282.1 6-pyruvoyltetrahydropterin/6-carboxytetrahydropterin synthase [Arthrobacter sp. CAN_C5]
MYRLTVRDHVMIAHSLPDPFFGPAQGLHGATLVVEVTWRRRELTEHAVVIDIGEATAMLGEVLDGLRYRNLDEHPDFAGVLSTTEAVARYIADRLQDRFDTSPFAGLDVVLREHPDAWAGYSVEFDPADVPG